MTLWILEARDPLIFGDGKPFSAIPGSRAKSLPAPYPSTLAGSVRTRAGTDPASGKFVAARIPELLQQQVRGPFLVELSDSGVAPAIQEWLLPAPADALLLQDGTRRRLRPLRLPAGASTNLQDLAIVGTAAAVKQKPADKPPLYWRWPAYLGWLQAPADGPVAPDDLGHAGPVREARVHVSIDTGTQRADEGALFQTSGMEYNRISSPDSKELSALRRFALALETSASVTPGIAFLGGERRVVRWSKADAPLPACPPELRRLIIAQRACRLVLVTPGCFDKGWQPAWVLSAAPGVTATLVGAAVARYQTVSGWDYAAQPGRPKPTRRLAPAGSVYFLKLEGDEAAIGWFVDAVWLQPISDSQQDRLDGFGLALAGAWDGKLCDVEVAK